MYSCFRYYMMSSGFNLYPDIILRNILVYNTNNFMILCLIRAFLTSDFCQKIRSGIIIFSYKTFTLVRIGLRIRRYSFICGNIINLDGCRFRRGDGYQPQNIGNSAPIHIISVIGSRNIVNTGINRSLCTLIFNSACIYPCISQICFTDTISMAVKNACGKSNRTSTIHRQFGILIKFNHSRLFSDNVGSHNRQCNIISAQKIYGLCINTFFFNGLCICMELSINRGACIECTNIRFQLLVLCIHKLSAKYKVIHLCQRDTIILRHFLIEGKLYIRCLWCNRQKSNAYACPVVLVCSNGSNHIHSCFCGILFQIYLCIYIIRQIVQNFLDFGKINTQLWSSWNLTDEIKQFINFSNRFRQRI